MSATPSISVVICTRNRGDNILLTLQSLLANTHPNFEVIVLDQSVNDLTAKALDAFRNDPRLRYFPSNTIGLARARNIALALTRAELIAFTDDDCEVPSHWVETLEDQMRARPAVAILYCDVEAAEYDRSLGFTPIYACQGKAISAPRGRCPGIGAGMAVRKSAIQALGGFDEMLGAGAQFPSFEDADIALRALLEGYHVYQTDEVRVLHYGFRDWEEVRVLIQRDFMGIGAGHAKLLKCGQFRALNVCAYDVWRLVAAPFLWHIVRLRKPPVLHRGLSLARGFVQGLRAPVDRERLVFQPSAPTSPKAQESSRVEMPYANV